jgi:hypothetical protein
MGMRPVVVLRDEGMLVTPVRFMAHMEAGDQVIFEGGASGGHTEQPWWNDGLALWTEQVLRDRVFEGP